VGVVGEERRRDADGAEGEDREGRGPEAEAWRADARGAQGGEADEDSGGPDEPVVAVAEEPGLGEPEGDAGEGDGESRGEAGCGPGFGVLVGRGRERGGGAGGSVVAEGAGEFAGVAAW
jgi:hypothetical protein